MRKHSPSRPALLSPGDVEYEFGIPIPGQILPRESWTQTALRRFPEPGALDWTELFGRQAPLCLDIGCGNGRFSLASALLRPDWNHVAIDPLPAVIRYGTRRGNQRGIPNLRFGAIDGWRILQDHSHDDLWSEIHIYHPQPYADPKKASRRMLTPDFVLLMHNRLQHGGTVYLQTDRKAYWDYMCQVMPSLFSWTQVSDDWPTAPEFRSRREILARKQGLPIFRGVAQKQATFSAEEQQARVSQLPQPRFSVDE